jgi:hypothetical protein
MDFLIKYFVKLSVSLCDLCERHKNSYFSQSSTKTFTKKHEVLFIFFHWSNSLLEQMLKNLVQNLIFNLVCKGKFLPPFQN